MKMTKQEYARYVKEMSPNSPFWKDVLMAFLIGGLICTVGQAVLNGFTAMGLDETNAGTATSVVMVFLSAVFTGLSLYDNLAKHAGAGTLVPITGFANSVASPALEFKTEGVILGTCVKMFTIAGPVLVFGITASILYGLFLWAIQML